jgi:hypothetical protein
MLSSSICSILYLYLKPSSPSLSLSDCTLTGTSSVLAPIQSVNQPTNSVSQSTNRQKQNKSWNFMRCSTPNHRESGKLCTIYNKEHTVVDGVAGEGLTL